MSRARSGPVIVCLGLVLATALPAGADPGRITKYVFPDGTVVYSDKPVPGATAVSEIVVPPGNYFAGVEQGGWTLWFPVPLAAQFRGPDQDGSFAVTAGNTSSSWHGAPDARSSVPASRVVARFMTTSRHSSSELASSLTTKVNASADGVKPALRRAFD